MEWLILRLHRQAVARFGPLTTDLSNWIRLYRELLKPDKELREMIRRHKDEAREFKVKIAELREQQTQISADLRRIKESLDERK